MRRFFTQLPDVVQAEQPATAEKLRGASLHWMRHGHASHALVRGAELTTVRDNLRHASIAKPSMYLHGDEVQHAMQIDQAFAVGKIGSCSLTRGNFGVPSALDGSSGYDAGDDLLVGRNKFRQ